MLRATGALGAPAGGLKGCQFGDGSDAAHLGPAFACNNKLIGAYAFMATYMAIDGAGRRASSATTRRTCARRATPRATARTRSTTAAGDCVTSAVLYGVERGPVCGIAPGARVIMYRVCLPPAASAPTRSRPSSRRSPTAST